MYIIAKTLISLPKNFILLKVDQRNYDRLLNLHQHIKIVNRLINGSFGNFASLFYQDDIIFNVSIIPFSDCYLGYGVIKRTGNFILSYLI